MNNSESIFVEEAVNSNGWTADQKARVKEVKEELKKEAKEIRSLKHACKNCQRGTHEGEYVGQWKVDSASWEWRHKHLAYCMLKGRSYEEIERKCSDDNKPDFKLVEKYKEEIVNG